MVAGYEKFSTFTFKTVFVKDCTHQFKLCSPLTEKVSPKSAQRWKNWRSCNKEKLSPDSFDKSTHGLSLPRMERESLADWNCKYPHGL